MNDKSIIKEVVDSATALASAMPIYQDLAQPAAKQLGKSLEVVAKTVNMALAPLSAAVWGYEKIQIWLESKLVNELKDITPDQITPPNPHVVGPAIEALRYAGESKQLREMFAKLIATSMTKDIAENAHPTFVEILKQISSDEAKVITGFLNNEIHPFITVHEHFNDGGSRVVMAHWTSLAIEKECDHPAFASIYMENLARLGVLEFNDNAEVESGYYDELIRYESIRTLMKELKKHKDCSHTIEKGIVSRTMLGSVFMDACIGGISGSQATLVNVG
ncbi:DUF4393 domain-containing protein [Roseivirga sp. BDSF3-8]|uniref:DUF4393 domain-containing protein n=1 Tax=Roseivirga sp. BDSF3-8 TaxID=3241598 RepID=UPI0035319B90